MPGNPFAPSPDREPPFNPFAPAPGGPSADPRAFLVDAGADDAAATPTINPFLPASRPDRRLAADTPRKLRLLTRGLAVFGSYAKVLLLDGSPVAYAQFGPLSAYPRAQQIRDLYPRLPSSPLPAVITCVATTVAARGMGLGAELVSAVTSDLASRGFAAAEAYPDLTLGVDEASTAHPRFWARCGFSMAIDDERYPVMRIELH
jgi:ribosomal protein S18 acetylase RimI-like enzyme